MPTNATMPAPIMSLFTATSLYALQIEGNALAPKFRHNDIVVIEPAVKAAPETIPAGSVVLAVLANPDNPDRFERTGLFFLNSDGDIYAGSATIEKGGYLLLGVVQENYA